MIKVSLNYWECFTGGSVALNRKLESRFKNLKNSTFGKHSRDEWKNDIEGALCEMAFCKAFGMYWDGSVNTFKNPDVPGTPIQIRGTEYPNGNLIIRENDPDDDLYILVVGSSPNYKIIGGIYGHQGKVDEFINNPNNQGSCWMIPQTRVFPIENILIEKKESEIWV